MKRLARPTVAIFLAAVVAAGCAVRSEFIHLYGGRLEYLDWADTHYFGSISRLYVSDARSIHDVGAYNTLLYPPGYSGTLAGFMRLGATTTTALRVAQAAGDALFAIAMFLLARAVRLSVPTALIAAAVYAMTPLWASGSTFLLAEALSPALVIGAIGLSIWAAGRRRACWLVAGAVIGYAVLVRPDLLLLIVPSVSYAAFPWRRDALVSLASIGLGVALVLGPWGLHNRAVHGSWTFTSTGGGASLLEGLGDRPGPFAYLANDSVGNHIVMAAGLRWGTPEASRFMTSEYFRMVRRDPVEVLRVVAYRWRAILFESEHLQPLFFGRARELTDQFGFASAVVALILARNDRRAWLVIAAPLFVALFGIGLVHYEARYVRYVQLAYVVAALIVLERAWIAAAERARRLTLVATAAVAVLAVVYAGIQLRDLHRAAQAASSVEAFD